LNLFKGMVYSIYKDTSKPIESVSKIETIELATLALIFTIQCIAVKPRLIMQFIPCGVLASLEFGQLAKINRFQFI